MLQLRKERIGVYLGVNLSQIHSISYIERLGINLRASDHEDFVFTAFLCGSERRLNRTGHNTAIRFEAGIACDNDRLPSGKRLADRFECLAPDNHVVAHRQLAKSLEV